MNDPSNLPRPALLVGVGILVGMAMMLGGGAYNTMAQGTNAPGAMQAVQTGCQTFSQTGYKVCGRFLAYWNEHGGLAQQGYPLSEEFTETSQLNGRPYTVQYFERAVFEYHPENQAPNDVLLSQLGTYLGKVKYTQGFPTTAGEVPFYEDRTSPTAALVSFYNAINRREYQRAYGYFRGAPNPSPSLVAPYAQWVQGYSGTASVTLATGKVLQDVGAGNIYASFPVVVTAKQTDSTLQIFAGCYTMHRANTGISENLNDELWSISSANIRVIPDKPDIEALLAQSCAR